MQETLLDWLVADFSVFGVRLQHWMLIAAFILVSYAFIAWLDHQRFYK